MPISPSSTTRNICPQLAKTAAGACLVAPALAGRVPAATTALVTKQPYHGFARALLLFYPDSLRRWLPSPARRRSIPSAKLEDGVLVEPGAVIGPEARSAAGTRIAAGAVIGARVTIGRNSTSGRSRPSPTRLSVIGSSSIRACGSVRTASASRWVRAGHLKVPQIGRVIVQDDVEIGANTTIDRGALKDTIIGEGTKIDNLVQIGHNVIIGRHCVIVCDVRHLRFDRARRLRRHGRPIRNRSGTSKSAPVPKSAELPIRFTMCRPGPAILALLPSRCVRQHANGR